MMTSARALGWIEENSTLHRSVDILYVVDGVEVSILQDGEPTGQKWHGKTLLDAIAKAAEPSPCDFLMRLDTAALQGLTPPDADELAAARGRHFPYNDRDASTAPSLPERIARLLADAEQLAVDLREARNAAPAGEKGPYRYPCRHIEHAVALIRKAGI